MAVAYGTILRQAGLRVNALVGSTASALQATYVTSPLTSSQFDSADFPFASFTDACLAVESKLANTIASTGNHPWRASLAGVTASIAHKGVIPATSSASKSIIGVLGSVYDATDGTALTERPLEVITRRVDNPGTFFKSGVYWYKIDDRRIYHTRTNVVIDVCVYDRTTQATAIGTLTNPILLPDALEEAYVSGMVSLLVRDDAFERQAVLYRNYFNETLMGIRQGLTSVPQKAIPGPTLAMTAT